MVFFLAVPTVSTDFEETNSMCYLCFSSSSVCNLVDIDAETQRELEKIGLTLVQVPKVPPKFCETCSKDVTMVVTYLNRVKSANSFWHKFGLNIGIIKPITTKPNTENENVERNWECKECDYKGASKESLFKHVWTAHTVNRADPTTCSICNKKLATEYYNSKHFLVSHYEGISEEHVICSECGFLAKTSTHLTWHLKHTHGILGNEYKFYCEWCTKTFPTQARLDVHTNQYHPERFEAAQQEVKEKAHEENVFDEDSTPMDVDDRNSPYEDEDELPLKVKSEPKPKEHVPVQESSDLLAEYKPEKKSAKRKPKYQYKRKEGVNRQDDVTQKCPDCEVEITGKVAMAVGGLRRHYWVRHGRIPETPNVCRSCNKSYNNEHCCRIHYFNKHFDMSFFCDICGKSDMTKGQLGIHKLHVHKKREGKTFMVCRFCTRKYDSIEKMQEHEKEHENDGKDRPYVCNECGKCYTNEQTLQRHIQLHLGKF